MNASRLTQLGAAAALLGTATVLAQPASEDRWSPGAKALGWDRVEALQAYPAFREETPNWAEAFRDSDPVIRAAAALAWGRSGPTAAAPPLAALLGDDSDIVRSSALWALLQIEGDAVKEPLVSVLRTWRTLWPEGYARPPGPPTVPAAGYGPLLGMLGLPSDLGALQWDERVEWLSRFDRSSWKGGRAVALPADGQPTRCWMCAERSEWDGDESIAIVGGCGATAAGRVRVDLSGLSWRPLGEQSAVAGPQGPRPRPSLRTLDGLQHLEAGSSPAERLQLTGDPAIWPDVYVLQGPGTANPLFFRVRRSRLSEGSLARLIDSAASDASAVGRLGEMRVRAAAPALIRRLQGSARPKSLHDEEPRWRYVRLIEALSRLESPEAAAAVVPTLMRGPGIGIGDVLLDLSPVLRQFGELARPYVESYVLDWRNQVGPTGAPGLSNLLEWPGFARGSAFAGAVEEIATTMARSRRLNEINLESRLFSGAIRGLARFEPERAAALLEDVLRRPESNPPYILRHTYPVVRRGGPVGDVVDRVWEALQHDASVPKAVRAELADDALDRDEPLGGVTIPGEAIWIWLTRSAFEYAPPSRFEEIVRIGREALRRNPDPVAELLLAELLRRSGRWSEAIERAEQALPRLPRERLAFAYSVLAFARVATGELDVARTHLETARRLGGEATWEHSRERHGWRRNLQSRPAIPGLRIRYEPARFAGTHGLRAGSFWAASANRLRFSARPGDGGDLVAATPAPATAMVELGEKRVALVLADGSVVAYEAGRATPSWRTDPSLGAARITRTVDTLVVETKAGVTALDPGTGQFKWSNEGAMLANGGVKVRSRVALVSASTEVKGTQVLSMHDLMTGAEVWRRSITGKLRESAVDADLLVWSDSSGGVEAASVVTGHSLWRVVPWAETGSGCQPSGYPRIAVAIAPRGERVVASCKNGVIALDGRSGIRRWSFSWSAPAGSTGSSDSLLVVPASDTTYVVGVWFGSHEGTLSHLHELIRLDEGGRVMLRAQGPICPHGGTVTLARATDDGVVLDRGDLSEIWSSSHGH